MNCQELETAKRLGVGFVCLVMNNNNFGLIKWKQELSRNSSVSTELTNPDFKAFAESFGIKGYKPTSVNELRDVLSDALAANELCLIEVFVEDDCNTGEFCIGGFCNRDFKCTQDSDCNAGETCVLRMGVCSSLALRMQKPAPRCCAD